VKIGDKIIILKKEWEDYPYNINDIAIVDSEIFLDGSFSCSVLKNGCKVYLSMREYEFSFKKCKKKIG